jgi:hypothetical protein
MTARINPDEQAYWRGQYGRAVAAAIRRWGADVGHDEARPGEWLNAQVSGVIADHHHYRNGVYASPAVCAGCGIPFHDDEGTVTIAATRERVHAAASCHGNYLNRTRCAGLALLADLKIYTASRLPRSLPHAAPHQGNARRLSAVELVQRQFSKTQRG